MIKCDEPSCDNEAVAKCEDCSKGWCLEHCLAEDNRLHCPNCGRKLQRKDTFGLPNPDCFA